MTKEVLKEKAGEEFSEERKSEYLEAQKEDIQSEEMDRFQKQQSANLQIKEAMAKELTMMKLPEYIIHQILNIAEDEPPF